MGVHSHPTHRKSSESFCSIGSEFDFISSGGSSDDDSTVRDYFADERYGDDSSRALLPHPFSTQDAPTHPLPLRRRLGAGSSIAAVTSPEIRALNLPITPPVPSHRSAQAGPNSMGLESAGASSVASVRSLSPASTASSASTPGSYCSATSLPRTSMSSLIASLEEFNTGTAVVDANSPPMNRNMSKEFSCCSTGSPVGSVMESITEESAEKTRAKTNLQPKERSKKHQRKPSNGLTKYLQTAAVQVLAADGGTCSSPTQFQARNVKEAITSEAEPRHQQQQLLTGNLTQTKANNPFLSSRSQILSQKENMNETKKNVDGSRDKKKSGPTKHPLLNRTSSSTSGKAAPLNLTNKPKQTREGIGNPLTARLQGHNGRNPIRPSKKSLASSSAAKPPAFEILNESSKNSVSAPHPLKKSNAKSFSNAKQNASFKKQIRNQGSVRSKGGGSPLVPLRARNLNVTSLT